MALSERHLIKTPCLTRDLQGIGGIIKAHEDDFVVEEVPLYEASGEGTHVFFMVEKRNLTTLDAVRSFSRLFDRKPRDIGYAGMKDARGVTRQVFSVEHVDTEQVLALDVPNVRVIWAKRHTNKLKTGHLAGNRFVLRIRDHDDEPLDRARPILDMLSRRGVPNYYGPQRFGNRGINAAIGEAAIRGDWTEAIRLILGAPSPRENDETQRAREAYETGDLETCVAAWPRGYGNEARLCRAVVQAGGPNEKAWRRIDHKMRTFYVSALQSELFNRVVSRRIDTFDRLEDGDLAWLHRNGACFLVEQADKEQPRCDAFEISPTGPIFGAKMSCPQGQPAESERVVLADAGVAFDQKRTVDGIRVEGSRRPLRVPLANLDVAAGADERGPFVRLSFDLPPGSYATAVTRELCKSDCT